jgi:hypothetical protein
MIDESTLTPNQSWLLAQIRSEWPDAIAPLTIKAEMGVARRLGAAVDESRIFRDLDELKKMGLVADTLGGLQMVPVKREAKVTQGMMF